MVEQSLAALGLRGDFHQPDGGLDGFNLAKERADATEFVMPPVLEKSRGLWSDLPLAGVWQVPPRIDILAHLVDDGGGIVLLLLG